MKTVDDVIDKIKYELNNTELGLGIKQLTLCNNLIKQEINSMFDELEEEIEKETKFNFCIIDDRMATDERKSNARQIIRGYQKIKQKIAKMLGRKATGIEISEKYCKIAVERLRQEILL